MHEKSLNDTEKIIADLKKVTEVWSAFEKKQLITWRIRLFIGLSIATIIYLIYPNAVWVWWLVLGLSAFSLSLFAVTRFLIHRKLNEAHNKIKRLKELEQKEKLIKNKPQHNPNHFD